jgi:hypothetical protein
VDFAAMAMRRGIPALELPRTVVGFLKLVELCKGLKCYHASLPW